MSSKNAAGSQQIILVFFAITLSALLPPPAAATENVLHSFAENTTGYAPLGSLTFDAAGNLYGTTISGGSRACAGGCGTVFKLTKDGDGHWKETVLYVFRGGYDGQNPIAGVVFDAAGNLYGTTSAGGRFPEFGTVFKLSPSKNGRWRENVLHHFSGGTDGGTPYAGLIFDSKGRLYGTTFAGGNRACYQGCGTVFRLSHEGGNWRETVLYAPSSQKGEAYQPYGGLTFDRRGRLYGTSSGGGEVCCGTVFRLTPTSHGKWTLEILHSFTSEGQDGDSPFAGVTLDGRGNIFGTTVHGGLPGCINQEGCGVVFRLNRSPDGSWTESVLHRFTGEEDGANPFSGITLNSRGDLFGASWGNGIIPCRVTCGTVFRLSVAPKRNDGFKVLHRFKGRDGAAPNGNLAVDANGNLYGVTQAGGASEGGVVFKVTPQ